MVAVFAVVCSAASAAPTWTQYRVAGEPLTIALPSSWKFVPRSPSAIKAAGAAALAQHKRALAEMYGQIWRDPEARRQARTAAFDAFAWPQPTSPVMTDVVLRAYPGLTDADLRKPSLLRSLANRVAGGLRRGGASIRRPRAVSLKIGRAFQLAGTQPLDPSYGRASRAFTAYIFILGHKTYALQCRADSRFVARYARLWPRVAARLRRT